MIDILSLDLTEGGSLGWATVLPHMFFPTDLPIPRKLVMPCLLITPLPLLLILDITCVISVLR